MPEIIIAVGADPDGNLSSLYVGPDSAAAHQALSDAIASYTPNKEVLPPDHNTIIGYVFENPIAHTTMRAAASDAQPPPPGLAPTIMALNPNTAPANADITLAITGTDFDPATVKVLVGATELTPDPTPTATDLSVLVPAAEIATAGTIQIRIKNGDGQQSNPLDFTVT